MQDRAVLGVVKVTNCSHHRYTRAMQTCADVRAVHHYGISQHCISSWVDQHICGIMWPLRTQAGSTRSARSDQAPLLSHRRIHGDAFYDDTEEGMEHRHALCKVCQMLSWQTKNSLSFHQYLRNCHKCVILCQTGTCPSLFGHRFINTSPIKNLSSSPCSADLALIPRVIFMTNLHSITIFPIDSHDNEVRVARH